jgi:hypothetical protein
MLGVLIEHIAYIALGLFFGLYVALVTYQYGKGRGRDEAIKSPNLIYPNLPDITIIGKYRVPKQTPEQMINRLSQWMIFNGYRHATFPNVVRMIRVVEPEEAQKKKKLGDKLQHIRDGNPEDLTLFLSPSNEEDSLDVEARCLPTMYRKIGQNFQFLFPRSSIDDARILCSEFMNSTMHILQAKTLMNPRTESSICPVGRFGFLYNTPTENNVNKKAHELIQAAAKQIVVTGWIDREVIGDLENAKSRGVSVRLITKNPEGSDKIVREDFARLILTIGKDNIKINSRSHDRFIVCDFNCLIGSMYYTDASKTRFESVIYTDDNGIIEKLLEHFERIWKDNYSKPPSSSSVSRKSHAKT